MKHFYYSVVMPTVWIICMIVFPLKARAQYLTLKTIGGQEYNYNLSDKPRMDFSTDGISISATGQVQRTESYGNVTRIDFHEGLVSAIHTVRTDDVNLSVNTDGNSLIVAGWTAGQPTELQVYSLEGKRVKRIAGWDGQAVAVNDLSSGVYIITIRNTSLKFIKK